VNLQLTRGAGNEIGAGNTIYTKVAVSEQIKQGGFLFRCVRSHQFRKPELIVWWAISFPGKQTLGGEVWFPGLKAASGGISGGRRLNREKHRISDVGAGVRADPAHM